MDCVVHGVSKSRTQLSDFHFQMTLAVKNLPANAGDMRDVGLISGLGRSSGEGNGYPLQCFCLGNPMERGIWWATAHGDAKQLDMIQRLNKNKKAVIGK